MSFFSKLLSLIVPLPKITKYQRYLFIGPHPDDIEIGAGATACLLSSMGKYVKFLICTDGRYGTEDEDIDLNELVKIRQNEAIKAAEHLGIKDIEFLPFPDGGDYERKDLTKEIARVICCYRPDFIFAPDPKLITELHIDHINTGEASSNAYIMSLTSRIMKERELKSHNAIGIAYYFTDKPNQIVATPKIFERQFEAILKHKSQFNPDTKQGSENIKGLRLYLKLRSKKYGLRKFKSGGEAFRVLGVLNTHCSPESVDY